MPFVNCIIFLGNEGIVGVKAWVVSYLPSNLWACGRCHYCWYYECGYAEAFAKWKGIHQKAGFVGWCNCYYLRKALLLQHMFIVVKEFEMYNLPKMFVVILGGQRVLCTFDFIYGIMRIPTQPPFLIKLHIVPFPLIVHLTHSISYCLDIDKYPLCKYCYCFNIIYYLI